ncbi:NADP(H)-dependent aldo-keto reductase [Bermanella sp. WJH001]|uniref:NADP(H)-dependent aldo-keto reductase n=1 Tax=Bermanella sp. WJH001 TaxID=3048005 RepID=UPI0024BEAF3E|nr:NADP(H)-dependent aldo-keto reductase [Bermanella sp. WJH001]MDJ1537556.1 NADP(H)-dependent aldo-keto reductase [Bermanella sp. WJH001]
MKFKKLGNTNIDVSLISLGTMTWGEQNTEQEAHEQLDYALSQGINFIDTAEMYPVPPKPETQGLTEQYVGTWLNQRGQRDDIVLATKVAGPGNGLTYLRNGPRLTKEHIHQAIETSLQRLQTDYVDLYQLHWPDRNTNFFGQLGYQAKTEELMTPLFDSISAINELVQQGKIRHWGLSNETPWGVMKALSICEENGFAKPVSIQNPYNLLNRTYEVGLAEVSHRENIGLLAYSPMAFGALSGKYLGSDKPEKGRLTLYERFTRYNNEQAVKATKAYVNIAHYFNLTPAQMSLAFVNQQSFVTSNIIGATTMDQLKENIASIDLSLNDDVLSEIAKVHGQHPNPAP